MNCWDVAAAYFDWEPEAISNLKRIVETRYRKTEIVVAMAPKATITFDEIKVLFALHGLDEYVTDICRFTGIESRSVSVYLEEHPLLNNYVFLSAVNHLRRFAGHVVLCESPWLDTHTANQVERIFKNGFWWDYRPLEAKHSTTRATITNEVKV